MIEIFLDFFFVAKMIFVDEPNSVQFVDCNQSTADASINLRPCVAGRQDATPIEQSDCTYVSMLFCSCMGQIQPKKINWLIWIVVFTQIKYTCNAFFISFNLSKN